MSLVHPGKQFGTSRLVHSEWFFQVGTGRKVECSAVLVAAIIQEGVKVKAVKDIARLQSAKCGSIAKVEILQLMLMF
jgi:hypothetical protein